MHCPNILSPQWKNLVEKIGETNAWREFFKYGTIPNAENYDVNKNVSLENTIDNKNIKEIEYIEYINNDLKNFIQNNSELTKNTLEFIYKNLDSDIKNDLIKENIDFVNDFNTINKKTTLYQKILKFIKNLFFKTSLEKIYSDFKKEKPLNYLTDNANFTLFGITKNQKLNKTIINNVLNYTISPINYDYKKIIKKAVQNIFNKQDYNSFKQFLEEEYNKEDSNNITENIKLPSWVLNITEDAYNKRHDAWRLSNGLPQKHNSFYYVGQNDKGEDVYNFINPLFTETSLEKGIDKYNFVMGKYGVRKGIDDVGSYIQYYDRWDLDISDKFIKYVIDKTQKPFNVEGKLYNATVINENGIPTNYLTFDKSNPDIKMYNDFLNTINELNIINEEPFDFNLNTELTQEDISCKN
jgi:hypothetical protein